MAPESPKYAPSFAGPTQGVVTGEHNVVYNTYYGVPHPVDSETLAAAARQLAASPHLTSQALIGHQGERDHLCTLHDQLVAAQRGQTVVLTSPPGYGRHALVQALITYAQAQGSAVVATDFRRETVLRQEGLAGYAAEIAPRCPHAWQIAGDAWLAIMARLASLLESLQTFPRLPDLTLDDDPARGLAALLRHAALSQVRARTRPLVLAWECVDQATPLWSEILRYLAPEIRRDLPVLLVVTATAAYPLPDLPAERRTAVLEVAQTLQARQEAMVETMERLERIVEQAIERLERSQAQAMALPHTPRLSERSPPISGRSKISTHGREAIIARIRYAKDTEGKSYKQIAHELNERGLRRFRAVAPGRRAT